MAAFTLIQKITNLVSEKKSIRKLTYLTLLQGLNLNLNVGMFGCMANSEYSALVLLEEVGSAFFNFSFVFH